MSRSKLINEIYNREIKDSVLGASLSIKKGAAYGGAGRHIQDGIIMWDVFADSNDAYIEVEGLAIYELITTGTLQKAPMVINIMDFCSMLVTQDIVRQWTQDASGQTTARNVRGIINVAALDYETVTDNGSALAAVAVKMLPYPVLVKNKHTDGYLRALAITTASLITYDNSATLYIDLIAKIV